MLEGMPNKLLDEVLDKVPDEVPDKMTKEVPNEMPGKVQDLKTKFSEISSFDKPPMLPLSAILSATVLLRMLVLRLSRPRLSHCCV